MPRYPSAQVAAVAQRHKVVIRDHQMVQQQNVHDVECLLQDHLVIADDDFVSLRDSGYLR